MDWLMSQVKLNMLVSSALLALWSALFILTYFLMKRKEPSFVVWGVAMAVLSLQPLVQVVAALSVPFACCLFWCIQMATAVLLVAGLLSERPRRRRLFCALSMWVLLTLPAVPLAFILRSPDGITMWLAGVFLAQGLLLTGGALFCAIREWHLRRLPAYIALVFFAAASGHCAYSLLAIGTVERFPIIFGYQSMLVSNMLSFVMLIQTAFASYRAKARLESLVEHSTLGLAFVDAKGRVVQANGRMLEILGVDAEAFSRNRTLVSTGLKDIMAMSAQDGSSVETLLDYDEMKGRGYAVNKTGKARLSVLIRTIMDEGGGTGGVFIQAEDITTSRDTLNELAEKRTFIDLMLQAGDAYEYSREGTTVRAEGLFRSLGYSFASLEFLALKEMIHPQDRSLIDWAVVPSESTSGRIVSADMRFKNAEGAYVWHHISSRDELIDGRAVTLGIASNIDLHKRLESHLAQGDRLAAVGQLANGVAHDISNHLMTVQTSLGMLATAPDEEMRKKCISYMQEAITNSTAILKSLVSFSKGGGEEMEAVQMNDMLAASVELLRRSVGIRTLVEHDCRQGGEYVQGNYYDLQNAVLNIGLNARDALPEKGGKITVKSWVRDRNPLKPESACRWYYISIRDNGCGMSAEVQKRIFDPFFTTKPKGKGTGLGLYTTYGNVQRHGGTITVESGQGDGTEFVLAFPMLKDIPPQNPQKQ